MADLEKDFVHTMRLILEGKPEEARLLMNKATKTLLKQRPDLSKDIKKVTSVLAMSSIQRNAMPDPLPVDSDSRLELLKKEHIESIEVTPIWPRKIESALDSVIEERDRSAELLTEGLLPTRSMLFVGPPGVGKTLAAKWLAVKFGLPLLTLDLAAVMSSYLGKTGSNIRVVLDYAKKVPSILLLDEFDAIAKRRDDVAEVGELKRLVTVLLQAVDEWPSDRLLVAATNHPELLDPAVWRRFDRVLEFSLPDYDERLSHIKSFFNETEIDATTEVLGVLSAVFENWSFAEIDRQIKLLKRSSILNQSSFYELIAEFLAFEIEGLDKNKKLDVAKLLSKAGFTQRKIREITGHSRDTLRDHGIGTKRTNNEKSL